MAYYIDEGIVIFDRASRKNPVSMPEEHYHNKHELYFLEQGKTKYFIGSEIFFFNIFLCKSSVWGKYFF